MRYRRGEWYGGIFFFLAIAIVYGDKLLDWISDTTGWAWKLWHLVTFELFFIGAMILTTALLTPNYPTLKWWHPVSYIVMISLFRLIHWLAVRMFHLDD